MKGFASLEGGMQLNFELGLLIRDRHVLSSEKAEILIEGGIET